MSRRPVKPATAEKPCTRCGQHPRHVTKNGAVSCWCLECKRDYNRAYFASEAGRAAVRRYFASEKGQQARRRANAATAQRRKQARAQNVGAS